MDDSSIQAERDGFLLFKLSNSYAFQQTSIRLGVFRNVRTWKNSSVYVHRMTVDLGWIANCSRADTTCLEQEDLGISICLNKLMNLLEAVDNDTRRQQT